MTVTQPPLTPAKQFLNCVDRYPDAVDTLTDKDAADSTSAFVEHLKWLERRHVKTKTHSSEYLISNVFRKSETFGADPEIKAYCRCHLRVAIQRFEALLKAIAPPPASISLVLLKQHKEILRDYVFDLIGIAEFLEQNKDPNYIFLHGGKNVGVHSWELYRLGRQLAMQSSHREQGVHYDHKTAQIAAIFLLRQALELRFKRLIAVDPQGRKGESPRLRHGFHFDFIVAQPHHFEFRGFEFQQLRKVYDWCSEIVHHAYQPYVWQTDWAFELCHSLLGSHKVPDGKSWSIHNGVRVLDLAKMQSAFCTYFVQNYDHGTWCFITSKPEAETAPS